jgi:hypothetical protein
MNMIRINVATFMFRWAFGQMLKRSRIGPEWEAAETHVMGLLGLEVMARSKPGLPHDVLNPKSGRSVTGVEGTLNAKKNPARL